MGLHPRTDHSGVQDCYTSTYCSRSAASLPGLSKRLRTVIRVSWDVPNVTVTNGALELFELLFDVLSSVARVRSSHRMIPEGVRRAGRATCRSSTTAGAAAASYLLAVAREQLEGFPDPSF